MLTNVRIARRGEVYGEWFVSPEEWPTSLQAGRILTELAEVQALEPEAGWRLEMRGSHTDWHEVKEN